MDIREKIKLLSSIGTTPSEIRKRVNKLRNKAKKMNTNINYALWRNVLDSIDDLIGEWNIWAKDCSKNEERMNERNFVNDQMKHFMITEVERIEALIEEVNNL